MERISEQARFARRRFGHYEVIDIVAVLFGYAVSGERTLEAFYQQLQPWAEALGRGVHSAFWARSLASPFHTQLVSQQL